MIGRRGLLDSNKGLNTLIWYIIMIVCIMAVSITSEGLGGFDKVGAEGGEDVTRLEVYTVDNKYSHHSGQDVHVYAGLSLGKEAELLTGSKLEIRMGTKYLDIENIVPSPFENMKSYRVYHDEDQDEYVIEYELADITGGVSIDVPFNYHLDTLLPSSLYEYEIYARFVGKEGNILRESDVRKFGILRQKMRILSSFRDGKGPQTLPPFGLEDSVNKGYLSTNLTELNSIKKTFSSYNTAEWLSGRYVGRRMIRRLVIEQPMSYGMYFDEELNTEWVYDEENNKAIFDKTYEEPIRSDGFQAGVDIPDLYIKFPGAKIGERLFVGHTATFYPDQAPEGEEPFVTSGSAPYITITGTQRFEGANVFKWGETRYDTSGDKLDPIRWVIGITNPAQNLESREVEVSSFTITDRDLDENLRYKSIRREQNGSYFGYGSNYGYYEGNFSVEVLYKDGTKTKIIDNVEYKSYYSGIQIPRPDEVEEIKIIAHEGGYLPPHANFLMSIDTEFKDPSKKLVKEGEKESYVYNYADFDVEYQDRDNGEDKWGASSTVEGTARIRENIESVRGDVKRESAVAVYLGDEVDYRIFVKPRSMSPGEVLKNVKVYDLLPIGMEYVKGSAEVRDSSYSWQKHATIGIGEGKREPVIIPNFKNTGRTALYWELGDITVSKFVTSVGSGDEDPRIEYKTTPTSYTLAGDNVNEFYATWDNMDKYKPHSGVLDKYDILELGEREDRDILGAASSFKYYPPKEMLVVSRVKGSEDDNYLTPPLEGTSVIGGETSFEIEMYNNSVVDFTTVTLLGLVPKEGDKFVSNNQHTGKRDIRGSTFDLTLNEAVVPPKGFNVYYTTDVVPEDVTDFTTNGNWETSLEDYTKATAIKLVMKEGEVFKSGERRKFYTHYNVPKDPNLTEEDKVIHTYGTSVMEGNIQYFETNESILRVAQYKVNGHVFNDGNRDGIYNDNERGVSGHKVSLVDPMGEQVYDLWGNPYETITNEEGHYEIVVLKQGNYRVKVDPIETKEFTILPEGYNSSKKANHITLQGEGLSDIFRLDLSNKEVVRNGGFIANEVNYKVEHINLATGREITDTEIGVVDGILQVRPREDLVGYKYNNYYTVNGGGFRSGDSYTIDQNLTSGDVRVRFYYTWDGLSRTSKRMKGDDGRPSPIDIYTNSGIYTRRDSNGKIMYSGLQVNTTGITETHQSPIALKPVEINIDLLDEDNNVLYNEVRFVDGDVYLMNDEYLNKVKINSRIGESDSVSSNYGLSPNITNLTGENSRQYNMSSGIGGAEDARMMAIGGTDATLGVDEDINYLGRWAYNQTDLRFWSPNGELGTFMDITDNNVINNAKRARVTIDSEVYNIMEHQYESREGSDGLEYFEYVGTELQQGYYGHDSEDNMTGSVLNTNSPVTQTTYIDISDINVGQYINADGFNEEDGEVKPIQNKVSTELFDDGLQTVVNSNTVIDSGENSYNPIYEVNEVDEYEIKDTEEPLVVDYYEEFGYIPHQVEEELITQQAVHVGGIFYYLNPYDYTMMPAYANDRVGELSGIPFTEPIRNHYEYKHEGKFALSEVEYDQNTSGFYMSDVDEHEEYKGSFATVTEDNKNRMNEVLTEDREVRNYYIRGTKNYKEYKENNEGASYLPVNEIQGIAGLEYRMPITYVHNIQEFLLEDIVAVGKDSGYPVVSEPEYIEDDFKVNYLQDFGVEPTESDKLITTNKGSIYLLPLNNLEDNLGKEYRTRLFINDMGISQTSLVEDRTYKVDKYLYGRGDNTLYSGERNKVATGGVFTADQKVGKNKQPIEIDYVNGVRMNVSKEKADELLLAE